MRTVVADCETDGLNPTKVFCIVCKDIDTKEVFPFIEHQCYKEFVEFSKQEAEVWIGHNFINFDSYHWSRLLGTSIKVKDIRDTLVLSRLANPIRQGGHSLASWGQRVGLLKEPDPDWTKYSDEMLERCKVDVEINERVYFTLLKELEGFSKKSIWIEHQVTKILDIQRRNGFHLDREKAHKLLVECRTEADKIEREIKSNVKYFGPRAKAIREITPKKTKKGELSSVGLKFIGPNFSSIIGGKFTRIEWKDFELTSPKQVVERLAPWWTPVIFTPTGQPQLHENNFKTINDKAPPAVKRIGEYYLLNSRAKLVSEQWLDNLGDDNRIHGSVISCGASTHRASHQGPNLANIPRVVVDDNKKIIKGLKGGYGFECRSCFGVKEGKYLIGCDASGIQLRIFAHHLGNKEYGHEVVHGDIHSKNESYLQPWCKSRFDAKTFIYAFLMGAGDRRVGLILGVSIRKGKLARDEFINRIPGLKQFLTRLNKEAKRGYRIGLDGRRVPILVAYKAMASYLQGDEASIMKYAYILWFYEAKKLGINFKNVAWIHDEWQTEVDTLEEAEVLGKLQVQSIIDVGEKLNMSLPLDGEFKIGQVWADTH
jgi:DNA polymerase-1